jgi:hypothetical protein
MRLPFGPGGGLVAESLQRWPDQGSPAMAVVDEAQFQLAFQPVIADLPLKRLDLARDRVPLGLLLRGEAGIVRHAEMIGGLTLPRLTSRLRWLIRRTSLSVDSPECI